MCYLLFCVMACHSQKEKIDFNAKQVDSLIENKKVELALVQIREAKKLVQSGDLILRTGRDYTSDVMRQLSRHDKTYSHCGIASLENDSLFVYHAIGGEWNPDQKLRRDLFEFFCNPYESRGFGIFRYQFNDEGKYKIVKTARKFYTQGIMFDMQFDLATDNRMYCSEFVYKTINKAMRPSPDLKTTTLNHITFVAIDNLFLTPYCREIRRVKFHSN